MKVYISVDMEGIAGVATLDQVVRGGHGYERACVLMTEETNAAIRGAFDVVPARCWSVTATGRWTTSCTNNWTRVLV
jgi:hypothetical protein